MFKSNMTYFGALNQLEKIRDISCCGAFKHNDWS